MQGFRTAKPVQAGWFKAYASSCESYRPLSLAEVELNGQELITLFQIMSAFFNYWIEVIEAKTGALVEPKAKGQGL